MMEVTGGSAGRSRVRTLGRVPFGQVARFAAVGAVNTGTYYGLYLPALNLLPYLAAHVLAFALSMTGSFFLTARFTYRTRPTWRKFALFPLTNAAGLLVTTGGVYVLVDLAHTGRDVAPLLAAAAAVPVTFALSRTVILPRAERQKRG